MKCTRNLKYWDYYPKILFSSCVVDDIFLISVTNLNISRFSFAQLYPLKLYAECKTYSGLAQTYKLLHGGVSYSFEYYYSLKSGISGNVKFILKDKQNRLLYSTQTIFPNFVY